MKRNILIVSLALSFLGLLTYSASGGVRNSAQGQEAAANAAQIEGTWRVTVTPPPGGPPSYIAFASFASGGVLITTPDPAVAPNFASGLRHAPNARRPIMVSELWIGISWD